MSSKKENDTMVNNSRVQSNADSSDLIESFVITSDPQYPWCDCTDSVNCDDSVYNGKNCTQCTPSSFCDAEGDLCKNDPHGRSIHDITVQYNSIVNYANSVGASKVAVMINGDVTGFGHGYQWEKMQSFFHERFYENNNGDVKRPNEPIQYYFGLGNHDYLNNMKDDQHPGGCANNGCMRDSLTHVKNVQGSYQPFMPNLSYYDLDSDGIRGSFSYFSEMDHDDPSRIRFIQLNAYPTAFPVGYHVGGGSDYVVRTDNVIPWMQSVLNSPRFSILNVHQPSDWKVTYTPNVSDETQDEENNKFRSFMQQNDNILAVFAGHYHYTAGDFSNLYSSNFGGKPVFLSGSAMNKSYLIAEHYSNRLDVYLVCNNDWKNKSLLRTIFIPSQAKIPDITLSEAQYEYDIWKNNQAIGVSLSGEIFFTQSPGTITFKYWKNGQVIHSEQQTVNSIVSLITPWENQQFDRITAVTDKPSPTLTQLVVNTGRLSESRQLSEPKDLPQITQQVQELFTSASHTEIAQTVSSYQLDQVLQKVDALSSSSEKAFLRKSVNNAKQMLRTRNLLINGDFETLNGWLLGGETSVSTNPLFSKVRSLFLLPSDDSDAQSYAYQKIDESKLKPYTRYTVSGFIISSQQLALSIYRYGHEISKILNVPTTTTPQLSADATIPYLSSDSEQPSSNFFSYSIDVGELHLEENPGIELSLSTPFFGFAVISNLEIVEERPLTETEILKIKKKEPKWKKTVEKERAEISATIQPVINQIISFFRDKDLKKDIHPYITYQDVYNVSLPNLYQTPVRWKVGENSPYLILPALQDALERVQRHLEEQNLIHNGSFTFGLDDWLVEGHALVTEEGVLQLSNWDSSASQAVDILDFDRTKEYRLIVCYKNNGAIMIEHGDDVDSIVLPSSSSDFSFYQSEPFSFDTASFVLRLQSEGADFIVSHVAIDEAID